MDQLDMFVLPTELPSHMIEVCEICGATVNSNGSHECIDLDMEMVRSDFLCGLCEHYHNMTDDCIEAATRSYDLGTCQTCGRYFEYKGGNELCEVCIKL